MYSDDPKVIALFISTVPAFAIELFTDLFQGAMSGVLRGMGYQNWAIVANLSYWIIMLPLSYVFAFTMGLGLKGIWMGVPIGSAIIMFSYLFLFFKASWKKASINASKRYFWE